MAKNTETGAAGPGADRRHRSRRTLWAVDVVLALLLVAAVAAAVVLGLRVRREDERVQDRAAAQNVAGQFALRMDTIDGAKIDEYARRVEALLTTKYKSEFKKQFEPFKQTYAKARVTGTGKVLVTATGDHDEDSATVLVVHDSRVRTPAGTQVRHQRWSVNLVKVKDRWLVDDFNPVN